ncbi:hypothetical protein [Providencia sp.]|uniref:hypothetical protein n=1 Tax=Providencia sp. TaxID=589 RepID=UPI003F98E398
MNWEIPTIPDKHLLTKPKYKIIISFLITIITVSYIYSLSLENESKFIFLLYTIPAITIIFFLLGGFLFLRYQNSVVSYNNWENEKKITKNDWQAWCQSSITILANVIYTPDKDGADVFLTDAESIPMYPDKSRPLFNNQEFNESLLSNIDNDLETKHPYYKNHLSNIYLINESNHLHLDEMIFNQWDIFPIKKNKNQEIFSEHNENDFFLIITAQSKKDHSEFISAQLFSSKNNLITSSIENIKIERVMPIVLTDFDNEINKYIEYSGISRGHKFQTWVSNTKQELIEKLIIAYSDKTIKYDKNHPVYILDTFYSTPHKEAFFTYISLLTDISKKTQEDQVLIHFNQDDSGYAVYISNRS